MPERRHLKEAVMPMSPDEWNAIQWTPERVRKATDEVLLRLGLASGYGKSKLERYRRALIRRVKNRN
jgi:hypothetical protein